LIFLEQFTTPLRRQIKMDTDDNTIGFDVISKSSFSSTTFDKHNKQEVKFMYSQLLKHILTKMSYSNDDMDNMIKFFQDKCNNQPKDIENIKEFRDNYTSETSIRCYTNYVFLYKTLNLALRTCDLDALCAMGGFIKDLHQQIVELHKSTEDPKILMLYRGIVMPISEFEEIKMKEGGLLSISSFLSTSSDEHVANIFANGASNNSASVLLQITIDQSIPANVSYASIQELSHYKDEREYLFTMGSVFRIESIKQIDGNANWCINLTLTADHDPELFLLTNHIQSNFQNPDLGSLCSLMLYMGEFEKAAEISETGIKNPSKTSSLGTLYLVSGIAYSSMGDYQRALDKLELALDYFRQRSDNTTISLSINIIKSVIFLQLGRFDIARTTLQVFTDNVNEYFDSNIDQERITICNQMMGIILSQQGYFEDALVYQKKACNMAKKCLPPTHPLVGECLQHIAMTYMTQGQMDEALLCIQESAQIMQNSMLPDHMLTLQTQGIYSILRQLKDDHSESESINQCLSTTLLKWQSDSKQNPMKLLIQARIYLTENKIDEALSTINEYFNVQKENLSLQHPHFLVAYLIKGNCHLRKKELCEALQNLKQGYEIGNRHFQEKHPMKLDILLSIANVYAMQNKFDEVINIIDQYKDLGFNEITNYIQLFGKNPSESIARKFQIRGLDHLEGDEYEKALSVFENCLKIQMKFLPHDHPNVADTYQYLADTLQGMNRYSDALFNYQNVRDILEKSVPSNDSKIAKIWKKMGFTYSALKQIDNALFSFNKYLQFQLDTLPLDHPDLADTYELIASALCIQEKSFESITNHQRALNIRVKHLSPTDLKIVKSWTALGLIYVGVQYYHDALLAFKKVLEIQSMTIPSEHIDIALTHERIADIYFQTTQYEQAILHCQKCLEIRKALLPPDHTDLAEIQTLIGDTSLRLSNYSDARVHYQCALDIQFKHLPEMNSKLVKTLKGLGLVCNMLERYEEALFAFHQCLEIQLNLLPSNHIDIADTHKLIGHIYNLTKNYKEALTSFQKCLNIEMSSSSTNPLNLADTHSSIGNIFFELNNFFDAIDSYRCAVDIQIKYLPSTTLKILGNWKMLGTAYRELRQYDDSLFAYGECLEIQFNILPSYHIYIALTHGIIGVIYFMMKNYQDALLNYQKCLEIQMNLLSPDDLDIAETLSFIGHVSRKLNHFPDAMNNYQHAMEIQFKYIPQTNLKIMKNLLYLADVYKSLHRYEDSLFTFDQRLQMQLNVLPSNHIDIAITHFMIGLVYYKMKKYEETLLNYQKCLDIQTSSLPPNHPDLANTRACINMVSRELNNVSDASSK
jgi:tetratricopeptide (TPR) repeat protein